MAKIFLTASLEERALRRHNQLKEKGVAATLAALSLEIAERDKRDITRSSSPLVASDDAVLLDTTGMSVKEVVERVLGIVRGRAAARHIAGSHEEFGRGRSRIDRRFFYGNP